MTAITSQVTIEATAPFLRSGEKPPGPPGPPPPPQSGDVLGSDEVRFSAAGIAKAQAENPADANAGPKPDARGDQDLSPEERQKVAELKARDAEVKAHEQAHLSALGGEGGSANYSYTTGPDGNRYATGGEVPVSIGETAGNPRETIRKAQTVARAAVAPAQPSAADQAARSKAQQVEAKARRELSEQQQNGTEGATDAPAAPVNQGADSASGLIDSAQVETPDQRAEKADEQQSFQIQGEALDHTHVAGEDCPICAAKAQSAA